MYEWKVKIVRTYEFTVEAYNFDEAMERVGEADWEQDATGATISLELDDE